MCKTELINDFAIPISDIFHYYHFLSSKLFLRRAAHDEYLRKRDKSRSEKLILSNRDSDPRAPRVQWRGLHGQKNQIIKLNNNPIDVFTANVQI